MGATGLRSMASFADVPAWERRPNIPVGTHGSAVVCIDSTVYLIGGTRWQNGAKEWLKDAWRSTDFGQTWQRCEHSPGPLAYSAAAVLNGKIYLAGGTDGVHTSAAVFVWDGRTASLKIASLATPRAFAASGGFGSRLFVAGGLTDALRLESGTADACVIDAAHPRVAPLPPLPSGPLSLSAGASSGDAFYVFGGAIFAAAGLRNSSISWRYSHADHAWERLPDYPLPVRCLAAVALSNGSLYIAGGFGGTADGGEFVRRAFVYDPKERTYRSSIPLPKAMATHLVRLGDTVFCLGGEDGDAQRTAESYRIHERWLVATH